ncbi:MAG: Pyrimidine dimer glycosylase [Bacteroidetes bacterium]|nr:Pyrimidine dimer glycosylase [Bacteroidota bacterium]
MRIWSLHPKYLDTKGLTAVWRETLLAKHVLEGKTKGYIHHPQLNRFRSCEEPLMAINYYLSEVYKEAVARGYHYDSSKFEISKNPPQIKVTSGQLAFERTHLLNKLEKRDPVKWDLLNSILSFEPHPLFYVIEGDIEPFEVIS